MVLKLRKIFTKHQSLFYMNYTIIESLQLTQSKPNHKQFQPYDYQHRVHNPLFVCQLSSPFPHPFFVDVCRRYAFNFRNDSAARLFPRLVNSVLELFFTGFITCVCRSDMTAPGHSYKVNSSQIFVAEFIFVTT